MAPILPNKQLDPKLLVAKGLDKSKKSDNIKKKVELNGNVIPNLTNTPIKTPQQLMTPMSKEVPFQAKVTAPLQSGQQQIPEGMPIIAGNVDPQELKSGKSNKFLTKDRVREIILNAPEGVDRSTLLDDIVAKGYIVEGYNDGEGQVGGPPVRVEPEFNTTPKQDLLQGGIKRGASRLGSDDGILGVMDNFNIIGKGAEWLDNQAQKIPIVSEKNVANAFNKLIPGFGDSIIEGGGPNVAQFIANIPGSLAKTGTAIARGITNPVDTATGLYKLVSTPQGRQAVVDRYGSLDNFAKTMSEDPVGTASDILTVVEGGANLTKLGAKASGASELAIKAGNVAKTAGGAADLGLGLVPGAVNTRVDNISNPIVRGAAKTVLAPIQPVKAITDSINSNKAITRVIPEKVIENDLGLTPTERAKVEATGITPAEFVLEKGISGYGKDEQVTKLQDIANESYNGLTEKFKELPPDATIKNRSFNDMLGTMIEEMSKSEIVKRKYQDYINKLKEFEKKDSFTPNEGLAIRRDFDAIVGKQMFDSKGRVSGLEDEVIAGRRSDANDSLQTIGEKYGVDMKDLNDNIRNSITIRDGLLRNLSQSKKNNYFGLQDLGIGAILSSGDPILGTAIMVGKKALEAKAPGIMQSLYNLNKNKSKKSSIKRGASFINNQSKRNGSRFNLMSDTDSMTTNSKGQELKLAKKSDTPIKPKK